MFCARCGEKLADDDIFCTRCGSNPATGAPGPGASAAASRKSDSVERWLLPVGRSGWAIAAGYLALFSVLVLPAPLALLCGVLGLRDIAKHPNRCGEGRAWFGIVMGLSFSVPLAVILFRQLFDP